MSNAVIIEESGPNVIVRFNRPEIRSPLSINVLERLNNIIGDLEGRDGLERLIFMGTGDVFASGADLREIATVDKNGACEFAERGQELMNRITRVRAKTVAAVNGFCFGGALDLALACDHRIASHGSVFAHPGADLGIMTGWGGTQRLPRLIGEARSLEMFFTARRVSASEAWQIGLIDQIHEQPVDAAMQIPI
jgi:enoyl-CoA hydratase/carnithine racemase